MTNRSDAEIQRLHGDRVEARQRINGQPFADQAPPNGRFAPGTFQDGILCAIDVPTESPFFQFWNRENQERVSAGAPELGYGEARKLFHALDTDPGEDALTFTGDAGEGLRAVKAPFTIGDAAVWFGEYRVVSIRHGVKWFKVPNNRNGGPIAYTDPTSALRGARISRAVVNKLRGSH